MTAAWPGEQSLALRTRSPHPLQKHLWINVSADIASGLFLCLFLHASALNDRCVVLLRNQATG